MPEEQSHANDTLADIQKELKDMRTEAEAQHQEIKDKIEDMRDDAKVKHQGSLRFAAYLFSGAVFLAGLGFHTVSSALSWQIFYAHGLMWLGGVSGIGFLIYHFCERRKRKALKGR